MRLLRSKPLLLVLLLLGVALLREAGNVKMNIALVLINRTLNTVSTAAIERQQQLALAGQLLEPTTDTASTSAMIPAVLQGIANLRNGETAVAATWFEAAASARPQPDPQPAIWVSPWMSIEKDSSLTLSGSSELWHIRPDTQKLGTIHRHQDGSATFECNPDGEADPVAFEWIQPFALTFHHTIQVKTWITRGTTLILETQVDGQLLRLLTVSGTDQWQTVEAPITGSNGRLIYLIVAQNAEITDGRSCRAQIIAVHFLLDQVYTNP